jgi:hypothetical protein
MRRRRRLRRRLLWTGVLTGLLVLLAAISVLRAGMWARDEFERIASVGRRGSALAH